MKKKGHETAMLHETSAAPLILQNQTMPSLPASLSDRDDLTVIGGIDPVIEMALNSIGIRKFADFAGYTPQILSLVLQARAGMAISANAIERQNWIVSATLLAGAGASKAEAGNEEMALRIQGVRFEPFEAPATDDAFLETRLRSEISCELTGPHAPASTAEEIFICAQIYAVNTATGECALLVFQSEPLQPGRTDYRFGLDFKAPEVGIYQLQVVAFLLHPVAKVAFYQGPSLRVIA